MEGAAGATPGLPDGGQADAATGEALVERCPTEALSQTNGHMAVDYGRCVHCYRCARDVQRPLSWQQSYEWAAFRDTRSARRLNVPFTSSWWTRVTVARVSM